MRKTIINQLMKSYVKAFPPLTKNKTIASIKRSIIIFLINMVGGKKARDIFYEIINEIVDNA